MYSATGFMQNALPVLHNALRLPGLRNANHLKLMESIQVDGILPRAQLWNICDSSNVIDAAKVKRQRDGCRYGERGSEMSKRERGHERAKWLESLPCRLQPRLLLAFSPAVIKQGMKNLVYRHVFTFKWAQRAILQGNIRFMQGSVLVRSQAAVLLNAQSEPWLVWTEHKRRCCVWLICSTQSITPQPRWLWTYLSRQCHNTLTRFTLPLSGRLTTTPEHPAAAQRSWHPWIKVPLSSILPPIVH